MRHYNEGDIEKIRGTIDSEELKGIDKIIKQTKEIQKQIEEIQKVQDLLDELKEKYGIKPKEYDLRRPYDSQFDLRAPSGAGAHYNRV